MWPLPHGKLLLHGLGSKEVLFFQEFKVIQEGRLTRTELKLGEQLGITSPFMAHVSFNFAMIIFFLIFLVVDKCIKIKLILKV